MYGNGRRKDLGARYNLVSTTEWPVMSSLKVDNLSYETTVDEIGKVFAKYGYTNIVDIYTPKNSFNNKSLGFAFVRFYTKREAEDAIESLDGRMLNGRKLSLKMARSETFKGHVVPNNFGHGPPQQRFESFDERDFNRNSQRFDNGNRNRNSNFDSNYRSNYTPGQKPDRFTNNRNSCFNSFRNGDGNNDRQSKVLIRRRQSPSESNSCDGQRSRSKDGRSRDHSRNSRSPVKEPSREGVSNPRSRPSRWNKVDDKRENDGKQDSDNSDVDSGTMRRTRDKRDSNSSKDRGNKDKRSRSRSLASSTSSDDTSISKSRSKEEAEKYKQKRLDGGSKEILCDEKKRKTLSKTLCKSSCSSKSSMSSQSVSPPPSPLLSQPVRQNSPSSSSSLTTHSPRKSKSPVLSRASTRSRSRSRSNPHSRSSSDSSRCSAFL